MKKKNKSPNKSKKSVYLLFLTAGILINLCFVLVAISLLILIKTVYLKDVNVRESRVNFSYFAKRPDLSSSAKALVVYDVTSKVVLLSKNDSLRFSPASTAKIMSALVALEKFDPNKIITVNSLQDNLDSSKMGLFIGEEISVLNLIYGMLLPSGGDAASVLAQNYPGKTEEFVKRMNQKSKELNMHNTYFSDPAGYNDGNYSTAGDLIKLAEIALKNDLISEIVKTKEITLFNNNKTIPHRLKNLNELLSINGVNGVKTGFTNEAEGVLITSFKNNEGKFIIVVLGSKDRFYDTRLLINGIIDDLRKKDVN